MRSQTWTLIAVMLGTFMLLLDVTIVVVALPNIQTALHASFADLQWTLDAYALSLASLLLASGSLADLYGRRRLFTVGLVVFTLGSLACGAATTSMMLVVCRAAQGVGGAIMFATSLALIAHAFQGKQRAMAFGVYGAVAGISTALGPVLGGVLTSSLGWRWIFFVNLPIGLAALWITTKFVEESRSPGQRKIDIPGFVVFTVGLLGLVYGLIRSSELGWSDSGVVGAVGVGAACLALFPLIEWRTKQPMFDLVLFKKPTFIGGSIAAFGMNGSLFAMFIYLVIYLQGFKHYSPLETGGWLAFITGSTLVTAIATGRIANKIPTRLLVGGGLVIVGVGLLLMRGLAVSSTTWHLVPGFIVAGIGSGLVNPALASTAVGVVGPASSGMASGINSTFRQVGIATSIAALGSIFAGHRGAGPTALVDTMNLLLLVSAVIALVSGAASLALIRARDFVVHGGPIARAE
jgi:EmrB/QacA subfamily drug resistance transporter